MIPLFIALVIIGLVILYQRKKDYYCAWIDDIWSFIFAFLCVWLGLYAITRIIIVDPKITTKEDKQELAYRIVSLRDQEKIKGNFFIGTGNIDSKPYYVFYQYINDSTFKQQTIETSKCEIVESNSQLPAVYVNRIYITRHFEKYYPWIYFRNKTKLQVRNNICECDETYSLIVPKGTIIKSFKLE
jgi:hypothetical protein